MRRSLTLMATFLATGTIALGACSSSSLKVTTGTTVPTAGATTTAASSNGGATTTAATGASTTAPSSGATTTAASGGGGSDPNSPYCQLLRTYTNKDNEVTKALSAAGTDPAKLKAAFDAVRPLLQTLADQAPAAIKADAVLVVGMATKLIGIFEADNYDFTKMATDGSLQKIQALTADGSVTDASKRLDAYGSSVCGIATPTT